MHFAIFFAAWAGVSIGLGVAFSVAMALTGRRSGN